MGATRLISHVIETYNSQIKLQRSEDMAKIYVGQCKDSLTAIVGLIAHSFEHLPSLRGDS